MGKNYNRALIYFEILMIAFYTLVTVGFILDLNNVLVLFTRVTSQIVTWPLFSGLDDMSLLVAIILYYLILFFVPVAGYIYYKKKYLIVHILLTLLVIINLSSFFYGLTRLAGL